jgi:hypothetical protein
MGELALVELDQILKKKRNQLGDNEILLGIRAVCVNLIDYKIATINVDDGNVGGITTLKNKRCRTKPKKVS